MRNKYEFTGEKRVKYIQKEHENGSREIVMRRIRRLSDALVGWWIEKEENLTHWGSGFVYDEAEVFEDASVKEQGSVAGSAVVMDESEVSGHGMVREYSLVEGRGSVKDNGRMFGRRWTGGAERRSSIVWV